MLTQAEKNKLNKILIDKNLTKRDLSFKIGYGKSYTRVVNVINRRLSCKPIEWQIRQFIKEEK